MNPMDESTRKVFAALDRMDAALERMEAGIAEALERTWAPLRPVIEGLPALIQAVEQLCERLAASQNLRSSGSEPRDV